MVSVRLDAMLKQFVPRRAITTSAPTVREALEELEARFPKVRWRLRDETGAMRRYVKVFVNGEPIDGQTGLGTPLAPNDTVDILHSIQGG
ncbi:MAG: MoaD/ThiS family protein [Thermoplasmata archaeon]|nr:MoaD/ThiS family protein [Thermoplasmata archaeon]MCI4333941.1 MoaD/ThiS family protein [Thermoplasmata archaeon]